jgi:hypothetical protein
MSNGVLFFFNVFVDAFLKGLEISLIYFLFFFRVVDNNAIYLAFVFINPAKYAVLDFLFRSCRQD